MEFGVNEFMRFKDGSPAAHEIHAVGLDSGYFGNPAGNATFWFLRDEGTDVPECLHKDLYTT